MESVDGAGAIVTTLIANGPIGVLCLALALGLRVMWKRNEDLWLKYDDVQKARISDREVITKALVESTMALAEVAEYLNSRKR